MQIDYQRQRDYWNGLATIHPDCAVIDPRDHRGIKNRYLSWLRDRAFNNILINVPAPGLILDFGCGTGSSTQHILTFDHYVIGVDIAQELLRHARQRLADHKVIFMAYDGINLPLKSASIDATTIYVVLSYVINNDEALALLSSIREAMRPAACIAIIEQARRKRKIVESGMKIHRTPEELRTLLSDAGFKEVRSRILRHGRFPTMPLMKLGLVPKFLWGTNAAIEEIFSAFSGILPWDYAEILLEAST